jgi:hypothetical protein
MRYIDADEEREAAEAYRNGIPLDRIAGHLRVTIDELSKLLNLSSKSAPQQSTELDLWAFDDAKAVL